MLKWWKMICAILSLVSYFMISAPAFAAPKEKKPHGAATANIQIDVGNFYVFSDQIIGEKVEKAFILTNTEKKSATELTVLNISAPFGFKGGSFPGVGGNCTLVLAGSDSCIIVLSFEPSATGSFSQSLILSYFDGTNVSSADLLLSATSLSPAMIHPSQSNLSFGSVLSAELSFKILNSGQSGASEFGASSLLAPFSFKGGSFPGVGGDCENTLSAGGQCTMVLSFNPTNYGNYSQSVQFSYFNGINNQNFSINISGNRLAPATIISSAATVEFGSITSGEQVLNFSNSGEMEASNFSIGTVSTPFLIKSGNCIPTLNVGNSCYVTLGFEPTIDGNFSDSLSLSYFDGVQTKNLIVTLNGSRISPPPPIGHLDLSFNQQGFQVDTMDGSVGRSIALQSDGKIVVAGYFMVGSVSQFAVARFESNGTLDSSFGVGGFTLSFLGSSDARAYGVAVQSNGNIFVVGYALKNGTKDVAIAKFTASGALDLSFNLGKGFAITDIGGADDVAYAVGIQADGKIVLAGYSFLDIDDDFLVLRYTVAGKLDTPFNGTGISAIDFGFGKDRGATLAIQDDGKILVAGFSTDSSAKANIAIARFNSNGGYDYTFGDGVTTEIVDTNASYATGIKIQSNGAILISGYGQYQGESLFIAARLSLSGQLDSSFANNGVNRLMISGENAYAMGVVVQSTGKVVIGGFSQTESGVSKATLAKLSSIGTLDTSYGHNGMNQVVLESFNDTRIFGLAVQDDDKIICVGSVSDGINQKLSVMRFMP